MDTKAYEKSRKTDTPLMPALCNACVIGNYELVDKLLVCGADVESKGLGGNILSLSYAVYLFYCLFVFEIYKYFYLIQSRSNALCKFYM